MGRIAKHCFGQAWPLFLCLFSYAATVASFPALRKTVLFPGRSCVVIWPHSWLTPLVAALLLLISLQAWIWLRKEKKGRAAPCVHIATPLILLPLSLVPLFFPSFFPLSLPSNIAVYVPVFSLSLILFRWLTDQQRQMLHSHGNLPSKSIWRPVVLITLAMTLFFWLIGWYFTVNAGEASGDEGHYIIQAMSLRQDLDLDLRNNFSSIDNKRLHGPNGLHKVHVSQYAKGGHLYSWHPFGISVLMAPFERFGLPGRHLILGLIAGLGSGAILLASLLLGAEMSVATVFTLLFSFSSYWGLFACRALPETAGGTLTAWLFATLLLYKRAPWSALLIGVLSCGLLPWFQTRFAPISVCGGLFFLFLIWTECHSFSGKIKQTLLFCGLAALAGAIFLAVQFSMFEGGCPYPIKLLLFSYPRGMWNIVFGWRSIVYMLPLFGMLTACLIWVLVFDRKRRSYGLMAMMIFLVILATSCSCRWWHGGSSPFGRYLLVISPLFVPFAALVFRKLARPAQWFSLFLGLISCAFFFLLLTNLHIVHNHFIDPRGDLARIIPVFSGLSNPFYAWWFGPVFFLVCFLIVVLWYSAAGKQVVAISVLFILAIAAHAPEHIDRGQKLSFVDKRQNTLLLENVDLRRAAIRARIERFKKYRIGDVFLNRLKPFNQDNIAQVTTEKLAAVKVGMQLSQPLIPINDWQGRKLSWATVIPPFRYGGAGERLFCVQGYAKGEIRPVLAVAELSPVSGHTALETALSVGKGKDCHCYSFSVKGLGQTHLLVHIQSGKGVLHLTELQWYPVGRSFLEKTGLTAPCLLSTE